MTDRISRDPKDLAFLREVLSDLLGKKEDVEVSRTPLSESDLEGYLDYMLHQYHRACGERPVPGTDAGKRFTEVMSRFFSTRSDWTIGSPALGRLGKSDSFLRFLLEGNCPHLIKGFQKIKAQIIRQALLNDGRWKSVRTTFDLSASDDSRGLQNHLILRLAKIQDLLKEKIEDEKQDALEGLLQILQDQDRYIMGYQIVYLLAIDNEGQAVFPASFEALVEAAMNNEAQFDLLYKFASKKQDKENGGGKNGAGGQGTPPEGAPGETSGTGGTSLSSTELGVLLYFSRGLSEEEPGERPRIQEHPYPEPMPMPMPQPVTPTQPGMQLPPWLIPTTMPIINPVVVPPSPKLWN